MKNNINKTQLNTFFLNEPLIIKDDQLLIKDDFTAVKSTNLFLGIGLMTETTISEGLPFDILGMLLVAEKIRKRLEMEKVIIQIADEHALSNKSVHINVLHHKAESLKENLKKIIQNLSFDCFEVSLSSEFNKDIINQELNTLISKVNKMQLINNKYLFLELADMEFFRRFHNVSTKISWIIPGTESNGHDERFFDSQFESVWNKKLNFINLQPRFTFNKSNWRTSPYIHKAGQNRILIRKNENIKEKLLLAENKWNDKALGGARKHLKDIVRAFESIFGNLGNINFEEKLALIINKVL